MPARPAALPYAEIQLLRELGERLRKARLRRRLTAEQTAAAAGITRMTLHRAEQGEPAITAGTLIKVLAVLGLSGDVALLARDDKLGRLLQDERLPQRRVGAPVRRRAARPTRIRIDDYPQLRQIAWHLAPGSREIAPEEAFALYERNWRHVEPQAMGSAERALVKRLTASIGKGVLLV
ncbi:MAG TPA: helix-turn-helix transcriptional regulator [Albitalea sp.]|nr:helix-turn-helix transcriptional regulator [Albitalea sp.]